MREHPLLMKGPLVRATLTGLKTQTRRPIKLGYTSSWAMRCPMGQAGDRLWVRETFQAWRKVDPLDPHAALGVSASPAAGACARRARAGHHGGRCQSGGINPWIWVAEWREIEVRK